LGTASRLRSEPGRAKLISKGFVHFPTGIVAVSPPATFPKSKEEKTGGSSRGKYPRVRVSLKSKGPISA
jgi:hypothetical protein